MSLIIDNTFFFVVVVYNVNLLKREIFLKIKQKVCFVIQAMCFANNSYF